MEQIDEELREIVNYSLAKHLQEHKSATSTRLIDAVFSVMLAISITINFMYDEILTSSEDSSGDSDSRIVNHDL